MIPYLSLGPKEIVYTWENPDVQVNPLRMWAITRIEAWLKENPEYKKGYAHIDPDRARWFMENRGIEKHRLSRLLANEERLLNPVLMMRMERTALMRDQTPWDLMLDGHHRYVALAIRGMKFFFLHHLDEDDCKPFEVSGVPQVGTLDVSSYSGIE